MCMILFPGKVSACTNYKWIIIVFRNHKVLIAHEQWGPQPIIEGHRAATLDNWTDGRTERQMPEATTTPHGQEIKIIDLVHLQVELRCMLSSYISQLIWLAYRQKRNVHALSSPTSYQLSLKHWGQLKAWVYLRVSHQSFWYLVTSCAFAASSSLAFNMSNICLLLQ